MDRSKYRYRVEGTGPAVVLVHGFAEDSSVWENQVAFLKNKFRLLIVDLPSEDNGEDWSLPTIASRIRESLDQEGITTCSMLGHSMGGYITLAFADQYPGLLNGFGLIHSSAYADNEEKIASRRKGIEFIREHGAGPFLDTMIPKLFSPLTREKKPALVQKALEGKDNFSAAALVRYYEAMIERPDRRNLLEKTKVPVLFVLGKHDTAVSPDDGLEQAHLPEVSYIHMLEDSGHMGMVEEPGLSNTALINFLQAL